MLRKLCDSPIHKQLSALLAFIFLFAICLSIPAAADSDPSPSPSPIRPNEPIGWKDGDTFRDILLVVLDSWGISFSKSDSSDNKSILEYSDELMQQFYEDNQTTQELFWDLVKFGASETGEIILDFLGVNKIRQFANWLKDKFSLVDNSSSSIPVSSDSLSNNFTFVPSSWTRVLDVDNFSFSLMRYSGTPVYFTNFINAPDLGNYWIGVFLISPVPTTVVTLQRTGDFTITQNFAVNNPIGDFYCSHELALPSSAFVNPSITSYYPSFRDVDYDFIADTFASLYGYVTVTTDNLDIPTADLDPDDGLQIFVPGTNWGDSIYTILDLIERLIGLYDNTQLEIVSIVETLETLMSNLQRSVTVENIPGAVTLNYDDYDIPLENEWGLFDIFFNTGGDEITLLRPWQELRAIIYGFPAPVLSFFALVVLFIVAYGFIRMGRDSH